MKPLSKEYTLLFNAITETEQRLMDLQRELMDVQQKAEDLYISETTHADPSAETISA